jgi:16S rRNA processing protein RimM
LQGRPLPADAVEVGRVQEAWGIKGWVRIHAHSADTRRCSGYPPVVPASRPKPASRAAFRCLSGTVALTAEVKAHADGLVALLEA